MNNLLHLLSGRDKKSSRRAASTRGECGRGRYQSKCSVTTKPNLIPPTTNWLGETYVQILSQRRISLCESRPRFPQVRWRYPRSGCVTVFVHLHLSPKKLRNILVGESFPSRVPTRGRNAIGPSTVKLKIKPWVSRSITVPPLSTRTNADISLLRPSKEWKGP